MTSETPPPNERRRSPRVKVDQNVTAAIPALDQDVVIRDLSLGGFLIESAQAFSPQAVHQFRVASRTGEWVTMLTAKSLHSRRHDVGGVERYLTGFQFIEPQGRDAQERIRQLVNQSTSVISY